MKVLVTGNYGYIGSHFYDPCDPDMEGVDLKRGKDFADVKGRTFDAVVHFAAYVSVMDSYDRPGAYQENNCSKVMQFLDHNDVGHFVFISTGGAMYGEKILAKEDDTVHPDEMSPYAKTKWRAEQLLSQRERQRGGLTTVLRLANVYGGDMSVRGEAAVHAHFATDNPITIYGGNQTRDFVHVDVVCGAIERALAKGITGLYNIGSGTQTRVGDLAFQYARDRAVPVLVKPARAGEVENITLDCMKAQKAGLI